MTFVALTQLVVVACPSPGVAERIAVEWSRCGAEIRHDQPPDSAAARFEVSGTERSRYSLATSVTMRAIGNLAGRALLLHAAGLANAAGVVTILVGPSGAGKTTAATSLAKKEFGYVSDEVVAVAADGTVTAYPKPLSHIAVDQDGQHKRQHAPDEMGLRVPPTPLIAGPFVRLERRPHTEPTLTRLGLADALLSIIPHTSFLTEMDQPLQQLCAHLERWGTFVLHYSEVADTMPLLAALNAQRPEGYGWTSPPLAKPLHPLRDDRYRRGAIRDSVLVEGEVIALVERTPVRIAGIGLTLWEALATGPATAQSLTQTVVATHGEHPDAERLVDAALSSMVAVKILTCGRPQALIDVMLGRSSDDPETARVPSAGSVHPGP